MSAGINIKAHKAEVEKKFEFKTIYNLLLYVSPVILLTLIFPVVTPRMSTMTLGGAPLLQVVLAVSITIPWLSQTACMPFYKVMGDIIGQRDQDQLRARFAEYWPVTFLMTLPALLLFAVPFYIGLGWTTQTLSAYLLMGILNIAFGQLLILANLSTSRINWALAWAAYSLALLIFPEIWFLPPIAGMIFQLLALRKHIPSLFSFKRMSWKPLTQEMLRGTLLGAVLWADKYVLFIAMGGNINVIAVYMGLMPTVIAYNYFFVGEAPDVDKTVDRLRNAIQKDTYSRVSRTSDRVRNLVHQATFRTLVIAVVCSLITAVLMFIFAPQSAMLALVVITTSWLFLAVTLYSYQVDYLGNHTPPQLIGAAHLILTITSFLIIPGTSGYLLLIGFEIVLAIIAYFTFRRNWSSPEYSLFWRNAMSW